MREIDSDALLDVAPALGVGNPATATRPVNFDDATLQQVLDVSRLVRRARAPYLEGILYARIDVTHAIAGQETAAINPWTARESTEAQPPWFERSLRESPEYDLWLLAAALSASSGTASNLNAAILRYEALQVTTFGTPTFGDSFSQFLGCWDGILEVPGVVSVGTMNGNAALYYPGVRLSRGGNAGGQIRLNSDAAGAVGIRAQIVLGIFPRGLEQDVAQ